MFPSFRAVLLGSYRAQSQSFSGSIRNRKSYGYILGISSGTFAVMSIYTYSSENARNNAYALHRIYNLVVTVTRISLDYGLFLYFESSRDDTKVALKLELEKAQNEYDFNHSIKQSQLSAKESLAVENAIINSRCKIEQLSLKIADLNSTNPISAVHTRSALRLKELCVKNKGVYIKLGQHLAQLDYILPIEYTTNLRSLLSQNPISSLESVRRVIRKEYSINPEEIWHKFEDKPIACGSLAQVHVAYDRDGNKFAVKVQHEGLYENTQYDMKVITWIIHLLHRVFPRLHYMWIAREMNENIPQELDFQNEAKNMEQCRANLSALISRGALRVPTVTMQSSRVLCLSFEDGVHVGNLDGMGGAPPTSSDASHSLRPRDVSLLISTVFCEQM